MAFEDYKIPSMDDIKKLPKEVILPAAIISVDIKTWREIITDVLVLAKFDKPDEPQVVITYECQGYRRDDKYNFYQDPSEGSKLGRYMTKYKSFPKVGQEIKVQFDSKGMSVILIPEN